MAVASIACDGLMKLVGSINNEPIEAKSFQKNLINIQTGDLLLVRLENQANNNFKAKIVRKIKTKTPLSGSFAKV